MNTGFLGPAVATVLTVYGIETVNIGIISRTNSTTVATVLTVYGIETLGLYRNSDVVLTKVATVLTVYGIETDMHTIHQ